MTMHIVCSHRTDGLNHVQGNCTNAPVDTAALQLSGAPLRPLLEGQCIIVADHDMLEVSNGRLWVDNVYFRIGRSPRVPLPRLLTVYAVGRLWLTRSTLQGDGSIEPGQGDNGVELSLGPGATGLKTGLVCAQGVPHTSERQQGGPAAGAGCVYRTARTVFAVYPCMPCTPVFPPVKHVTRVLLGAASDAGC